jgi:hypothetical protein
MSTGTETDERMDDRLWDSGKPLAEMVRDAANGSSYRELAENGVDPRSGFRVAHSLLWRIGKGEAVKLHPPLVRAIAAAIGRAEREVQLAAAQQVVGLVADDPLGASTDDTQVVIAHVPGMTAADMPLAQEVLSRWAARRKAPQGDSGAYDDGISSTQE